MNWYWLALGWAVCGFLGYGLMLAQAQRQWPTLANEDRDDDRQFALILALLGPGALIVALLLCRHGFMWRLPRRKDG